MSGELQGRRVLFFLNWLRTGAGMVNREVAFAREFQRRGAEVMILSHFEPQIDPGQGIPVETLVHSSFRHRWYDHWLTRRIVDGRARRILDRFQPELVYTDLPYEAERLLRLRGDRNFRIAYTYHGTADGSAYDAETAAQLAKQRAFTHRMLGAVDLPLVVSDHLLREALAEQSSTPVRVYNGVDLDLWTPGPASDGPPRVLYVGRYTECKGVLELVEAFGIAARDLPDAELQMHGFFERPAYEEQIRLAIVASGAAERIHMDGPLDFTAIPAKLHDCTVFANGSVDESFCMPFLEAQACGRACVGFDSRGIPEVVLHGKTGLLAQPGDVETFGANMSALLADADLRTRFERAGRAHAETFAYDRLTDELISASYPNLSPPSPHPAIR